MSGFRSANGGAPDAALAQLVRDVRARNTQVLDAIGVALKAEVQQQLSRPGMGRYYAKVAQASGETAIGPRTVGERTALARRKAANRKLNDKRRRYAGALNAGAITIDAVTSKRVLTGLHRASKPGDSPAPDTGALKRSTFLERTERGIRVGVGMAYGAPLEFGTTRAGRSRKTVILPRPFMRPALAATRARFGPIFTATLRVPGGA